jgi:hypothetical protein
MRDATDALRVVGIHPAGNFCTGRGHPPGVSGAGITLGILGILFSIAVLLIKLAVVIAVAYLVLVGVRAVLR